MANGFTPDEEKVFAHFGLTDDQLAVKKLICGQRKINGALVQAILATIEALENQATGIEHGGRSVSQALDHAKELTLKVAGPAARL